jgi:hypothetical protein
MSLTQSSETLAIAFAGGPLHNLLTRWPGGKAAPFAEITCAAGGSVLYSSAICSNGLRVLEQHAGYNRIVGELATHSAKQPNVFFTVWLRTAGGQIAGRTICPQRELRGRGQRPRRDERNGRLADCQPDGTNNRLNRKRVWRWIDDQRRLLDSELRLRRNRNWDLDCGKDQDSGRNIYGRVYLWGGRRCAF